MLWVGQLGLVDGKVSEETPWVGVFPEARRVEPQDAVDLFVVVEPARPPGEPAHPGSEDYCRDLAQAIGDQFRRTAVSLTGGILRALQAAHESTRDWNRRSLKEHRVGAGVSCLALRSGAEEDLPGWEAYLAQVAPAAAVILRDGFLERLRPTMPDATEPLGLYEQVWPEFSRQELRQGDRLLLLSSALAGALSDDELMEALGQLPEDTLPALYRKSKEMPFCAAVLVAALPEVSD